MLIPASSPAGGAVGLHNVTLTAENQGVDFGHRIAGGAVMADVPLTTPATVEVPISTAFVGLAADTCVATAG